MLPPVFGRRILASYAPLRATVQRKRALRCLSVLYNGSLRKQCFAITYVFIV